MIDAIIDALSRGVQWLAKLIVNFINRVIEFVRDIKEWFRSLNLKRGTHVPFIARPNEFKDLLAKAPVIHEPGIFSDDNSVIEGVFDNDKDAISDIRLIHSDGGLDKRTRDLLKDDELIVLS